MSGLEKFIDVTGSMSDQAVTEQDIKNIIDAFNRLQDQTTGGNIRQTQQSIIVFDNTTNRVLIGYQQVLQQWGMFVSKIGVDVTQATVDQLIFNSNQDALKVVLSGFVDNVVPSPLAINAVSTVAVPHGQSNIPGFIAFVGSLNSSLYPAGQYVGLPYLFPLISYPSWTGIGIYAEARIDASNIYFDVQNLTNVGRTGLGTWTFKYYILQETAT